jgi:pre-rRNA-processing protein TSR1
VGKECFRLRRSYLSGRVDRELPKRTANTAATVAQKRSNRRNAAKQAQANKRLALASATRIFNGVDGAPRIVAVIPLSNDVRGIDAVTSFAKALDLDTEGASANGVWRMRQVFLYSKSQSSNNSAEPTVLKPRCNSS